MRIPRSKRLINHHQDDLVALFFTEGANLVTIEMKQRRSPEPEAPAADSSGWLIANDLAQFMIMHTNEIKYMCMLGKSTQNHGRFVSISSLLISPPSPTISRIHFSSWSQGVQQGR